MSFRRRQFVWLVFALALPVSGGGDTRSATHTSSRDADRLPVLTRARDVQLLSIAEAKREYPVKLQGAVTYIDQIDQNFADIFIQDETAGIFVFLRKFDPSLPIRLGQTVEVSGVSTPGDFSPCIAKGQIRVLADGSLPNPKRRAFDELLGAKEDGRWTELEGVIRSGQIKSGRLFLNVAAYGGTFLAIVPTFPKDWATTLVDAKVAMRGVIAAIFNDRRQTVGFRLFVPAPSSIRIEEPARGDPFNLEPVPAIAVAQFRPQVQIERRVRVRATVTAVEPGIAIYISDGNGSLEVQSVPFCSMHAGDLLDVVGFPGFVDSRPGLQDSICRVVKASSTLEALPVTADEVLPALIDSDPTGYGLGAGKKYDAQLVGIEGKLLQTSQGPGGYTLVLSAGKRTFAALLPPRDGAVTPSLEIGSRIRLTGVCLVTFDQYRRGQYFRILLRTPGDIVVEERPPWWNLRRALGALCVTAFCCVAAITWIMMLRRQVAQRTQQLRELALRDPLTGAANRRQFDERLAAEFQRARRSESQLSLLMVDIDHFKALNDSEGHQRGDACLLEVVRALQSVMIGHPDLVARYGGEEFAVILPDMPAQEARTIAESMRTRVEQMAIPHSGLPAGRVLSVSVGAATWRGTDEGSAVDLIAAADRALYQAKSRGRNRTVMLDMAADLISC